MLASQQVTASAPPGDRTAGRAAGAPTLVVLHGFTQHGGLLGPLPSWLATDRPVVAVDLPGHGASATIDTDLPGTAALLADLVTKRGPGPVDVLGYSLGGRVALHVALGHPGLVRRLVLVGATPGLEDPEARERRRAADEALAARFAQEPLAEVLAAWLAQPLFRTLPPDRAGLAARQVNRGEDLARALRRLGTGTQEPLWLRLGSLPPTLWVAGQLDFRFAAVAVRAARRSGPGSACHLVAGAGHACHLERPEALLPVVRAFLAP
ncbi:alpha/beta fold hydrolase [Aciditerrimonas ferrireducens]|uniref:alpha/beta fold hydrolase n=1 Tax=Aciditerrimonas ferrireducens TaxID=667306 RepID=UPI002004CE42|nr:alpha/beta fold hydrolase [Aciditerrimonas ferrireducens]MCK4177252.1 alpha/beta fold hydrolase [Aciditerrimonas ferrireducens]